MIAPIRAAVLFVALAPSAFATQPMTTRLPACGDEYFSFVSGEPPPRPCGEPRQRLYTSKYDGLAYDILALESEACFVPDASIRLLDDLMDEMHRRIDAAGFAAGDAVDRAVLNEIGEITVDVLAERGFALRIGTRTIGDALELRTGLNGSYYYPFDCDIGALILLTIAQHYEIPASLVEVRLSKVATHNYVRWALPDGGFMDWDTNGRGPCETRGQHPSWQGRAWSADETLAYIMRIRAAAWRKANNSERELADLERAMNLAPNHPSSFNNYAWFVATREIPDRARHADRAQAASEHAVSLERSGNNLDTLACVYALRGEYARAAIVEREAVRLIDDPAEISRFNDRIHRFTATPPTDCTGDT